MTLREWLETEGAPTLDAIARKVGISYATAHKAKRGIAVTYPIAKLISDATNGEVSVASLCEGDAPATGTEGE